MTSELEGRLAAVLRQHAEEAMTSTHSEQQFTELLDRVDRDSKRRRRGWAAAGLVAATGTVGLLVWQANVSNNDTVQPASDPQAAVSVARGYLDAVNAYDAQRAASLLADTPAVRQEVGTPADLTRAMAVEEAGRFQRIVDGCEATRSADAVTDVTCAFAWQGLGSDLLGRGPYGGATLDVTVEDGKITELVENSHMLDNGFSPEMWEDFASWVTAHHPDDVLVIYTDATKSQFNGTPRAVALLQQYVLDYVADAQSQQ
jgi:hypothetical protein